MPNPALRPLIASCLALFAAAPDAMAEKLVVTRSAASADYLQKRMVDGKRQRQTYVFLAGRFYPGIVRDNTLDKTSFRTIAERLALDLRGQDFHPASSLANADLLLIVHWGVTTGVNRDTVAVAVGMENLANLGREGEEAQRELDEAMARGDIMAMQQARGELDTLVGQTKSEIQVIAGERQPGNEDRAMLLGLSAELRREDTNPFGDERRKALVGMTQEERYFVIVMAYDAPTLVNTRQLKRVWTLRASIRSAGVNFHQALDRIGNIASRYFGTRQEGVAFDYAGDRKRREVVTLGDLVVLGTVDR